MIEVVITKFNTWLEAQDDRLSMCISVLPIFLTKFLVEEVVFILGKEGVDVIISHIDV